MNRPPAFSYRLSRSGSGGQPSQATPVATPCSASRTASLAWNIRVGRPDSAAPTATRKATVTFSGSSRPVVRLITALPAIAASLSSGATGPVPGPGADSRKGPGPRIPQNYRISRWGIMRAMDYAEVREAFFQLREAGAPEPGTSAWQSPARRLRDAIEPIATICYWSEPSYDAYAALGLDFLQGYVWSRGCVLGEPDGGVVAAAFGVFEPGLIGQLYDAAREAAGLADIRAAREAGAVTALRTVLGAPERAAEVTGALRRGVEAADTAGRPLF